MVVLVHECVQQTHLLTLHIPIIGDPRGDNLMVGSMFLKLLIELGIQTEDAGCSLIGELFNFANFVLIIKVVWVSTIQREAINTPVIKMIQPV